MEEALFLAHGNKHPDPNKIIIENTTADQLIMTKNGEIQDSFADAYRATVIAKYKGDWLKFFCDWRARTRIKTSFKCCYSIQRPTHRKTR
jgi:hypothetical protein